MKKIVLTGLAVLVAFVAAGVAYKMFKPVYPPRMTVEELGQRLEDPALVVLDVRRDGDYASSDATIPGAVRVPPKEFKDAMPGWDTGKEYVLYCA